MKIVRFTLAAVFWIGLLEAAHSATSYVAQGGQTPASPYTNWVTAASNIQDAISVVIAGETVLVSNGVYEVGGVTNWPAGTVLTNRVAITNAIIVQAFSTNPADTLIKGRWHEGYPGGPTTNKLGTNAVRCVYMANGSSLIGFTLTNGATLAMATADGSGGGVYCPSINTVISNCVLSGNSVYYMGGGAYLGALFNCTLSRNSSAWGGGACYSILYNCTLSGNSAGGNGGGSYVGTLTNCTLTGNSAGSNGGGSYADTLYNCTLSSNLAGYGGGASGSILYNCTLVGNGSSAVASGGGANGSTLYNCTLIGNLAGSYGGGASGGTLYNCVLVGNSVIAWGGGTYGGTLYNCTLVGNLASSGGGGASSGTLINSIVYFNSAPSGSNWDAIVIFTNTCTAPAATNGSGNITADPRFMANGTNYGTNHVAGNYRLSANSPCLDAGTNFSWMTVPTDARSRDLDGLPRIRYRFVDMGAYEALLEGTIFYIH